LKTWVANVAPRLVGRAFPLLLAPLLALLFWRSLLPDYTPFSNDGPLGRLLSECHRLPDAFTGVWQDLEAVGFREIGAMPNVTCSLRYFVGPLIFSKIYAPFSLLLLGLSVWWFLRQAGLSQVACALGGLAAALNSTFFSAACWGVAAHPITIAMNFLALAALLDMTSRFRWLRVMLAGLAVGMGISEGYDVGAIFSCVVAAFVVYQGLFLAQGAWPRRGANTLARVATVAVLASVLAAQALFSLVSTQIEGVAGAQQDPTAKQNRWDWATQWSLPKSEALAIVVPGLFGYLMNTPDGGAYWGAVGQDASWTRFLENDRQGPEPTGLIRMTGGGNYAGVSVLLIGIWAGAQTLRRNLSPFSVPTRRMLWFWLGLGLLSLLLAFGRYAPFYRLLYSLPYASTVRNPAKFLQVLAFSLVVLFSHGIDIIWRIYLHPEAKLRAKPRVVDWFRTAAAFDRRWVAFCVGLLAASVVAWAIYVGSSEKLVAYLEGVGFGEQGANSIAAFSIRQPGWFVLYLALTTGLLIKILSKGFLGPRAGRGATFLGALLLLDLGRANQPWIVYSNITNQYATNPIVDRLRFRPFEYRVSELPHQFFTESAKQQLAIPDPVERNEAFFAADYRAVWLPNSFPRYNIQSSGTVQMSRTPEDMKAFAEALRPQSVRDLGKMWLRFWQLTNTRYLLGAAGMIDILNEKLDPAGHRFQIVNQFRMERRPGVTNAKSLDQMQPSLDEHGPLALFEFTGALPRARLFYNWESVAKASDALPILVMQEFDPAKSVLVTGTLPPPKSKPNDLAAKAVEITAYAPKKIRLKANTAFESVLLLNDRFDPYWKVWVDGDLAPILKCNYLMRGVHLNPGAHVVEFRFQPPIIGLYVSLSGIGFGLVLLGILGIAEMRAVSAPALAVSGKPGRGEGLHIGKPQAAHRTL